MSNSGSHRSEPQETKQASSTSTDQAQAQAQHRPPPPPLPLLPPPIELKPSAPSCSSSSSKPVWPDGYLLFLDPLSPSAIPKLVQNLTTLTNGHPPRQTTSLSEATHIVIDPHSPFGDAILQFQAQQPPSPFAPRPFLVTDHWLKQCILWSEWENEQDFLFTKAREVIEMRKGGGGGKGKGREREREREREEVQDVKMKETEEESDEEERTSRKLPNLPTLGRWLESEDDALARFLLPIKNYNIKDQDGRDAFDSFARTEHTRRSGAACREHYRGWKIKYDSKIENLRGGSGGGQEPEEWLGRGKGKEKEKERPRSFSYAKSERPPRPRYEDQEEADYRTCLKESSTSMEAARKMFALHPRRTVKSIERRYRRKLGEYDGLLGSGDATGSTSNFNPSHDDDDHQHTHPSPPLRTSNSQYRPSSPTDSESDTGFEPSSFLDLGVPPSSLPPSAPFCYWCGTGEDESEYFKILELAEGNPSDAEEITKVDGRLACSFCVERTEKWIAREDGGDRVMGELGKLAWVGRKLEYSGKKERATLVRLRDGGTAEED